LGFSRSKPQERSGDDVRDGRVWRKLLGADQAVIEDIGLEEDASNCQMLWMAA
jgi:hypothetical protein